MSAADVRHAGPRPRTSATEPITRHVDVYLEGDYYLRACVDAAGALGIPRQQAPLSEAISFRLAEQEIDEDTWICCLCEGTYSFRGFQNHVCSYQAAVMTATILEYTVPQRYVIADSLTALRYLKTGWQRAENPWAYLMWQLITQHLVTLFMTAMNLVDLPMRQILDEGLLEQSIVADHNMLDHLEALVQEMEEDENREDDLSE